MLEIWKDIEGFNGYQVSNFGNVKHLPYIQHYVDINNNSRCRHKAERVLKPAIMTKTNGSGYLGVSLYRNGKSYTKAIHRLVATAFIENPMGLPQINHIDEDKLNNRVDNLEWCTHEYNNNYGTGNQRRSSTLMGVKR